MSGVPASSIQRFELKYAISLESYVKLAKALGYSEEILQLLSEPKYDTMEEECASCQRNLSWTESGNVDPQALTPVQWLSIIGSSVVWLSMSMPKIWMTMHVISALSAARASSSPPPAASNFLPALPASPSAVPLLPR